MLQYPSLRKAYKNKIQIANHRRYRVAEFLQFLTNALQIIESNDPASLKIVTQYTALETADAALNKEYKKQTSSSITATLIELDERRDRAYTGILRVVSGFELHYEVEKRAAAQRIGLIGNKYGAGVTRLRYQQETGEIRCLVGDLQADAAAVAAIAELGLTGWVEEMRVANQAFDTAYVQRSQEMAGDSSQVITLRATALEKWLELTAHLTAHATLTPSALFTKAIAELNRLIDDYKTATVKRTSADDTAAPIATPADA